MAGADVIAAYCTGAAGIITALGGVIIAWRTSRGAKMAAEDAARSSIRAEATINTIRGRVVTSRPSSPVLASLSSAGSAPTVVYSHLECLLSMAYHTPTR